ncbi:flagellar basal body-associated FliL family protein [Bradyrhizobium sp. Leo170]|uniref:flagellar basal body-associated FliL family protein n=1 Tax=Bradyrhizobium sp. Leo170 TaxID=1571199 RepID=UPI001FE00F5B|nr:flagellar basal body-associated FliL family protein [Bradyrhizobium sp. Leo170]
MGNVMQWLAALLLITMLSAGAGGLASLYLLSAGQRIADSQKDPVERPVASAFSPTARLRKISPVVTNLAAPTGTWVRMEGSVVTDQMNEEEANLLAARLGEDIVSYLRTVSAAQIEGARGLQYLREDLNERAAIRSGGKVRELIIETLVVQ